MNTMSTKFWRLSYSSSSNPLYFVSIVFFVLSVIAAQRP